MPRNCLKFLGAALPVVFLLFACSHAPSSKKTDVSSAGKSSAKRGGGYYKDDGPGDEIPDKLDEIPDAVPRVEPLHRATGRPYVVFGKTYVPDTRLRPFRQRGIASWYGKKFHGKKTSIGEPYDMFSMTAAHPTLALPSYARVTNAGNGKTVIVRVIDRGPFHSGRVIDLSYAAAHRLGYIEAGSATVEIESILPGTAAPPDYASTAPAAAAKLSARPQDMAEALPDDVPSETLPFSPAVPPEKGDVLETLIARSDISEPEAAGNESGTGDNPQAQLDVYLQLGAFSSADNAENFRSRLAQELDWLMEKLRIVAGSGMYRVQLGPYPGRDAAENVARKVREAVGYSPSFVKNAP